MDTKLDVSPLTLGACVIAISLAVALNTKGLPFYYTISLLPSAFRLYSPRLGGSKRLSESDKQSLDKSSDPASLVARRTLFKPLTTSSRATLSDLDLNIHKSNSTFFVDADISRASLLTTLLSTTLARLGPTNFILAGVQCKFGRAISPFQQYTVSSRILTWDAKYFYVVTYFLKAGARLPADVDLTGGGPAAVLEDEKYRKLVFATMITKFVFKAGRKTVAPEQVFKKAGLLYATLPKELGEEQALGGVDLASAIKAGLDYVEGGL